VYFSARFGVCLKQDFHIQQSSFLVVVRANFFQAVSSVGAAHYNLPRLKSELSKFYTAIIDSSVRFLGMPQPK